MALGGRVALRGHAGAGALLDRIDGLLDDLLSDACDRALATASPAMFGRCAPELRCGCACSCDRRAHTSEGCDDMWCTTTIDPFHWSPPYTDDEADGWWAARYASAEGLYAWEDTRNTEGRNDPPAATRFTAGEDANQCGW